MVRMVALGVFLVLLQGCLLTKQERLNKRANRKLENLTAKYPQLLEKDTLRDTVLVQVPEIRIDTVVQTSQDVSGVDSILLQFSNRLDSVTALELGDHIKYYVTNRQVIEDTITHLEDGVTVKLWQEGDVIQISVFKPPEEVQEVVEMPYERVKPAPKPPAWKMALKWIRRNGIIIGLLVFLIWGAIKAGKVIKKYFTGGMG